VHNLELGYMVAQEHYHDLLAENMHNRRVALACQHRLPLARRVARPLGRQLLRLSLALLRYGRSEALPTTVLYPSSIGSVELN
jgi:hypothetical protein